jgi:DNA-binding NarL/FixJ family response regulator
VIKVMIVDDHAIVRQGLERLFATADDMDVVATAADGDEAVALAASTRPDVVLMDLAMARMDGVEATRRIVARDPAVRVVVLTSFGEEARILDALNAGALGYLLKHADPDDLISAVRSAHAGGVPLDPRAGRVLIEQRRRTPGAVDLTTRELEVLRLVSDGLANKQIARRLSIGERTVKGHLSSAFSRIGVTDRLQAALWVRDNLPEEATG